MSRRSWRAYTRAAPPSSSTTPPASHARCSLATSSTTSSARFRSSCTPTASGESKGTRTTRSPSRTSCTRATPPPPPSSSGSERAGRTHWPSETRRRLTPRRLRRRLRWQTRRPRCCKGWRRCRRGRASWRLASSRPRAPRRSSCAPSSSSWCGAAASQTSRPAASAPSTRTAAEAQTAAPLPCRPSPTCSPRRPPPPPSGGALAAGAACWAGCLSRRAAASPPTACSPSLTRSRPGFHLCLQNLCLQRAEAAAAAPLICRCGRRCR
mmetsp:Transcript_40364/g.130671  ORF Transcript_40364/g.130671 Transcript_40364/m.130671 type:complete len:267 (-) Transcript_40364:931-1731(-)